MNTFDSAFRKLNTEQRRAVETIDGPLLVLAGPGTGKTQLLSARVAYILKHTDTMPANILCLTFTESGVTAMRERLRSFIGDAAYSVTISTYHSFGSDIIRQHPQYFQTLAVDRSDDIRMERPIDELTQIQIIEHIVNQLPFDSLLLSARYYIKSVVSTISDFKRNLITPESLRTIAQNNLHEIATVQPILDVIVNQRGGISRKKAEKQQQYHDLLEAFTMQHGELIDHATRALEKAHAIAAETHSQTAFTAWKNEWLHKNDADVFTMTDPQHSQKMLALADVYEAYEVALRHRSAYDFDDMILRAISGIEHNNELRYNLQEAYQYILLDEFQDTNPSQFTLVKQIADHPVHEGRPNIMAVGDDDQAIFAFQGAHIGNMRDFLQTFRDVTTINLTHNYRSHADILHVAHNIAAQIEDRLHHNIAHINKMLIASSTSIPATTTMVRHEFAAAASEYSWIADKISDLIHRGVQPSSIAILSPKHAMLEGIVPFLKNKDVPVAYEKRENILQTEIVQGLRLAARLIIALQANDTAQINQDFPQVLSLPYWQHNAADIWQVNWYYARQHETRSWAEIALENESLAPAVRFYLKLGLITPDQPLEIVLDMLIGTTTLTDNDHAYTAPMKSYYFSQVARSSNALAYYEAIAHLSVIRSRIRDYRTTSDTTHVTLQDFLDFCAMYEAAEASLTHTHPIAQTQDAVQLMTAYKAKGLEFDHVFIVQAHDDVWGSGSRGSTNKLSLPPNLTYIRYIASSDDERLRLFFVAITRARHNLYITSHAQKDNGRSVSPLKYLAETDGISPYMPVHAQTITTQDIAPMRLAQDIETQWQAGHVHLPADFKSLLSDRLSRYRMSPTHLNTFIDVERGGPEAFLVTTLLRFPQAPSASGEYGTAIHNTLEWYQNQRTNAVPVSESQLIKHFNSELTQRYMTASDRHHAQAKGSVSLQKYLAARTAMFDTNAQAEVNFYNEGVVLGGVLLSGKIDRLEIDTTAKTLRVVDYKTGTPLTSWNSTTKAHKYRQQLYFYKFLLEGSHSWRGYRVLDARLEFIEPDKNGRGTIKPPLLLHFEDQEEQQLKTLIMAIWQRIQTLDLPDISRYAQSHKGTINFESDLIREFTQ